ncbi:MAG: hypothetical protein Q9218_003149 [Villophora microphyllina]
MYVGQPALLVTFGFSVFRAIAVHHGQGPRQYRRLIDNVSSSQNDLSLITDAPGPPTIQPGIPALQPSIPTSGVASLSIPPAHQTSSSRTSKHLPSSSANPQIFGSTLIQSTSLGSNPAATHATSPVETSGSASTGMTTSIPFLSELITQPVSQYSVLSLPTFTVSTRLGSTNPQPSHSGTWSPQGATTAHPTALPAGGGDPKDEVSTASMPSTLVYSFILPPYSGGIDSSGIVETMSLTSSAQDKDHPPSATTYSYSLPPYTPKVPTYVATSVGVAAVSMTTGAPGNPSANAHTTRIFLPHGSVDPTKDVPAIATSPTVPLYSPACLGNAYGGGYVITPTVHVANVNATGVVNLPPAYGFSYKLEPTQQPGYGAAVVIASTEGLTSIGAPLPTTTPAGSVNAVAGAGVVQISETSTVTTCPCEDAPIITSTVTEGLITHQSASGQGANALPNSNPAFGSITSGSADTGSYQATSLNQHAAASPGPSLAPNVLSSITSSVVNGLGHPSHPASAASATVAGSNLAKDATSSNSRSQGFSSQANSKGPNVVQGLQSTGTSNQPSSSGIAVDALGNMASYLRNVLQSTNIPGSGTSGVGISTVIQDAVRGDRVVSTASSAAADASSASITVGSPGATHLPQNQYYRAAATLGNTAINTDSAVSTQYLGSQLNGTLRLSGNGTDIVAFQGNSTKITADGMLVVLIILLIILLSK